MVAKDAWYLSNGRCVRTSVTIRNVPAPGDGHPTYSRPVTKRVVLMLNNVTCIYHCNIGRTFKLNSYTHANHTTMTSSGKILLWPYYLKTKRNVNIKLWDLCETLILYSLLSTFQLVDMTLTVNRCDVRRCMVWMESADWIPWVSFSS